MVTIKTNVGDIKVELFHQEAPETVKNFLQYVEDGFYNDTIFHRVIDDFMIQGGGFNSEFEEKDTREPIVNEADNRLSHDAGTIAMARTMMVHSATSQFFINVKDNHFLNYRDRSPQGFGYCVFGKVIDGMDIVNKIKKVKTGNRGYHSDVPKDHIVIKEIVRA